ncbi:hypothetical protein SAMN06265337_1930 [Hymenobacter gelipurpurascens]|uniref:Uncharacterized protein n=1 Tax=Hymenobacter gelipurpurascens TaxID=89968 RepID=A0A212TMV9_9BACT|nr:hypothetical protein SAMN06265337_1930 [Hymenobacter gelipurpurascens]
MQHHPNEDPKGAINKGALYVAVALCIVFGFLLYHYWE